ncbi:MAG: hydroxysqualene dehydroxylase HpnE [Acidimicrobiales bacterium]
MSRHVVVVGGGLAGISAALECADSGARVTLLERRNRLGGLTWSFERSGRWIDNGQHVFLRCCDEYLRFLARIGSSGDVEIQERLDVPVLSPAARAGDRPVLGRFARNSLPAPLHLARSLLTYPHLSLQDRLGLGRATLALRRLRLDDPALDRQTFGSWLAAHGQSEASVEGLWDLITVPTVNLPSSEASLAVAAKVFQTGLLTDAAAADIGWSRVPLGRLHGDRAAAALAGAGVDVRLGQQVDSVAPEGPAGSSERFTVRVGGGWVGSDAVVVAVPHNAAGGILPHGSVEHQDRLADLGNSSVVDVHVVFDRHVSPWPLMAAVRSPVQWVFDRTASSGTGPAPAEGRRSKPGGVPAPGGDGPGDRAAGAPQYLAVSLSAADEVLGRHPDTIVASVVDELSRLLPGASRARVVDSLVTKERHATFRATPGTAALRPPARTAHPGLAVAGAWTDTGWPATMEGAVRSGRAAARACLGARGANLERTLQPELHTEEVA